MDIAKIIVAPFSCICKADFGTAFEEYALLHFSEDTTEMPQP